MTDQAALKTQDDKNKAETPVASVGFSKETEPQKLQKAMEASLERAAEEAEKIKEKLSEQGMVPHHDTHLMTDDLDQIGATAPLKKADEMIKEQTVNIPIDQFELEKRKGQADDSSSWLKEKFFLVFQKAIRFGQKVVFGKPLQK